MLEDAKNPGRALAAAIFFLALAVFGAALWHMRQSGMLDTDDAYITFRYAENLAAGFGLVYNRGEHVLGTTTPLFCILLSAFRFLGMSIPLAADLVNLVSAGLCALLVFMIVSKGGSRWLGLSAALLFIFFPHFWLNLGTGMESLFTTFLCLLAVWLDMRNRPVWFGVVSGLLLLTRLDAISLLAALLLIRFLKSPRQAIVGLLVMGLVLLPWLVFSWRYFGSPIPHSLLAKKLIHIFPGRLVAWGFAEWFSGMERKGVELRLLYPALTAFSFLALLGLVRAFFKERWAMVFGLWIGFYVAGLSLANASAFFWYKVPMLSGYVVLAALGLDWLGSLLSPKRWAAGFLKMLLVPALVIGLFLQYPTGQINSFTAKELANQKLARQIQRESRPGAKVLAGEIGIIGFELPDYYIIDSAGLVSEEVYRIRLADKEKLVQLSPSNKWDWWGTENWVKQVIEQYHPEFIVSDLRYLHLKRFLVQPWFQSQYRLLTAESTGKEVIVLLKKK